MDLKNEVEDVKNEIKRIFHRQPRWKTQHLMEVVRGKLNPGYTNKYTASHFGLAKFRLMEEGFMHWDDDGFLRPGPHPVNGPLREY